MPLPMQLFGADTRWVPYAHRTRRHPAALKLVQLDDLPIDQLAGRERRLFGVEDRLVAVRELTWLTVIVGDHLQLAAIDAIEDRVAHDHMIGKRAAIGKTDRRSRQPHPTATIFFGDLGTPAPCPQ